MPDFREFHEEVAGNRRSLWRAGKWWVTAVLSALVGAGAALAAGPLWQRHSGSASVPAFSLSDNSRSEPSPLHTVNVSVTDGITQAVKQVEPAVMGVVNYARVSDFFTQTSKLEATGVGTGVLFAKDQQAGYVVTNNHVVEGAAKVEVVLDSGKHVQATVVGTDPYTDLAVLRVPLAAVAQVKPAVFANSDQIQVGEPAIAIGTPLGLDFADTVTAGIVSAKKRIMPVQDPERPNITLAYQAVIQTDAAINPGNSGGPLLNIRGEVIGINSSKIVAPNFEGMGFAIPSNQVRTIADEILHNGRALHPALGISGYSLSSIPQQWWPDVPVDYGVFVRSVDSAAARASGLKPQDVIVAIDTTPVRTMADLRTYLFQKKPGDIVKLRVYRGSQVLECSVKLGEMPVLRNSNNVPGAAGTDDALNPFAGADGLGE
ncbi:MAG: trypsin-like peptidase domain-containing protein [Alicyclobacillus sp.]|nr:trypsin-like peptidase domain-containing protein [Alicyclobacillus sp.]